jgi:hypothetical protein
MKGDYMLDHFEAFFADKSQQLKDRGVRIEMKRHSHAPNKMNVVLEADSYLASISAWEMGSLDLHVLDYHTGECLLARRYDFKTTREMLSVLEDVYFHLISKNWSSFDESPTPKP